MDVRGVVLAVGVLATVAGAGLLLVAPEEPGRTAALAAAAVVGVLAASVLARRPGARVVSRLLWVLAALAAAVLTAWSAVLGGWAGPGPALLVAGAVVTGGAVLAGRTVTGHAPRDPARDGTAATLGAAGALVLVAALTAGTAAALDTWAVTSDVAVTPPSPGGVVPDPVAVLWRTPSRDQVLDVRSGGGGVVVRRATAVEGLDARTGAVRWTHRRSGVETDGMAVSPDGRTVVVTGELEDPLRDGRDRLVTVLDAATGATRWTEPVTDEPPHVTDTLVTLTSGPPEDGAVTAPIVARSVDTGHPLWSAAPDPRCEFRTVPTVAAAVVLQDCPGPPGGPRRLRSVRALDPATGAARWTSAPVPVGPDASGTDELPVAVDGRTVVVDRPGEASVVVDVDDATVRYRESAGTRLALVGNGRIAELGPDGVAVRVLGPDGPVPVPAAARCDAGARPVAFDVVAGRPLLLCADDAGRFDLRASGRAPLGLGRLAGAPVTASAGWIVPVPGAVVVAASPFSPRDPGPEVVGLGVPGP